MKNAEVLFGAEVKKLRALRGITQEELAHQADIHTTYVSQLERGLKSPSLHTVLMIAQALQTPASEIIHSVEKRLRR